MTEKKSKPAAKNVSASKSGKSTAASGKPGTTKTATAKKTAAKKAPARKAPAKNAATSAAKPDKTRTPAKTTAATPAAAKKTPARKVPVKKAAAAKAKPAPAGNATAKPTPEERYRMVQTAAYFIAEQHGFQGRSDEHWAAAEREISARLGH